MEFYATGFGLKTTVEEKKIYVNRDLAQRKRSIELLINHLNTVMLWQITDRPQVVAKQENKL